MKGSILTLFSRLLPSSHSQPEGFFPRGLTAGQLGLFMAWPMCALLPRPLRPLPDSGPAPACPVHQQHCPESHFFGSLSQNLAMPGGRSSPPNWRHRVGCLPLAPVCRVWGPQSCPAWEPPRPSPLLCQDMALQNALYTGDLVRLQELFPPHSTADLLLESRAAEPRWSSHQRGWWRNPAEGLQSTRSLARDPSLPARPPDLPWPSGRQCWLGT